MTEPEPACTPIAWGAFLRTHGAVIASVALLIGSVTPWVTFGPFSYAGTHGDGILTLILGGLALLSLLVRFPAERVRAIGAAVCGVISVLITGWDTLHTSSVAPGIGVRVGWGLILTLAAAIALTLLSALKAIDAPSRSA